ncbi:MAG: hypothetical protein BGO68_01690 [Candidatus Amoebophilus sp. 36-38]|nr:MAG: hypothetical protein BGO68_01690 [Candidatus Amoebophilus sp. 36-38]
MGTRIDLGSKANRWKAFTPNTNDYVVIDSVANCIVVAVVYKDEYDNLKGIIAHLQSLRFTQHKKDKRSQSKFEATISALDGNSKLKEFTNIYAEQNIVSITICTNYCYDMQTVEEIKNNLNPKKVFPNSQIEIYGTPQGGYVTSREEKITLYYYALSNKFSKAPGQENKTNNDRTDSSDVVATGGLTPINENNLDKNSIVKVKKDWCNLF